MSSTGAPHVFHMLSLVIALAGRLLYPLDRQNGALTSSIACAMTLLHCRRQAKEIQPLCTNHRPSSMSLYLRMLRTDRVKLDMGLALERPALCSWFQARRVHAKQ